MNLYVGNDNLVTLTGLYDAIVASYANSATVTFVLDDEDGTTVTSGTLAYVTNSNGNYQGVLEDDAAILAGNGYTLTVSVDAGNDRIAVWATHARAITRT